MANFNDVKLLDGSLRAVALPATDLVAFPHRGQLSATADVMRWSSGGGHFDAELEFAAPYPFASHTFTSAGKVGADGPSYESLRSAYSAALWTAFPQNFKAEAGIQKWRVPETGVYEFLVLNCAGAYGGDPFGANRRSSTTARFLLEANDWVSILVGQRPDKEHLPDTIYNQMAAVAACGGTFVVSAKRGLLIAAGGNAPSVPSSNVPRVPSLVPQAGTYRNNSAVDQNPTSTITMGGLISSSNRSGITAVAGAGGGYAGDGEGGEAGGKSFLNGGRGGVFEGYVGATYGRLEGGFGGGGSIVSSTRLTSMPSGTYWGVVPAAGAGGYTGGTGGIGWYGTSAQKGGAGGTFVAPFVTQPASITAITVSGQDASVKVTRIS